MSPDDEISIFQAIQIYIDAIRLARSEHTARAYNNAMNSFIQTMQKKGPPLDQQKISQLTEDAVSWFAQDLKVYSPSTEQLYLTALAGFFEFLVAERLTEMNLPRVRLLIRHRSRKPGLRLPQFPQDLIQLTILHAINLASWQTIDETGYLINLRDRAFILTLADTGLRVHEACRLQRGDLDWNEQKAMIVGKGNRQAVVRFSNRSIHALKDYLGARAGLDGGTRRPLASLPLFSRHDKGAGKKIKAISTRTGQNIITRRVTEAIGPQAAGEITPHSFRHFFVTSVLKGSGGNLKMAQELARHRNIAVTQRYAHLSDDELDQGYMEIFDNADDQREN